MVGGGEPVAAGGAHGGSVVHCRGRRGELRLGVPLGLFLVDDGAALHLERKDEAHVVARGAAHDGIGHLVHPVVVAPGVQVGFHRVVVLLLPRLAVRAAVQPLKVF